MKYNIVLESFEGPMDLLMHLIDKAKIDIYDININEITEQYMEHLTKMEEMDLEVTSEFLVMAATLLEIKSKMLLPQREQEDSNTQTDEEEADPRLELVKKLIEYKKYKHASKKLKGFERVQNKVHYKPQEDLAYYSREMEEFEEMDLAKLVQAFQNILLKNKHSETFIHMDKIVRERYTLEECIQRIKNRLKNCSTVKFSSLFDENSNRVEIIVVFLSLLELIKANIVTVKQESNFSDILIIGQAEEDDS
ncbi:MAG TPA: segregation/condensation protein A [Tepidimicrobium sp.]|nr:segregation/condensation protein A [Tepidimicrobium sp.]